MLLAKIYQLFIHGVSLCIGSSLGIGISFIVNCTLIEISKSVYFAYYFATFFSIIGLYILIRSLRSYYTSFQNPDYIQVQQKDKFRHQYLIFLAIILIISSLFSFIMHTSLIRDKINYIAKIPIFSCLGIGVTFASTVTVIDIINTLFHLIQPKDSRPPINSSAQIIPMILICCLMGMAFGTIFGIMDMEEVQMKFIKQMLIKEENYCIPIGIICGGLSGLCATLISNNEGGEAEPVGSDFKPLKQEEEIEV